MLADHATTPECNAWLARYSWQFNFESLFSLFEQPVEVKCGSYGLGAFACQSMNSGAFLGSEYYLFHGLYFDADILIAYVGHILSNELADPMQCVPILLFLIWFLDILFPSELAQYTSYNYLFEVTPDREDLQLPVFDAAHLGNATRFLNHRGGGKDNVEARSVSSNISHSKWLTCVWKAMVVIGEHQIGFFTSECQ